MSTWAASELASAAFGDKRLTARLCRLVDDLLAQPTASLPQACGDWAATKAAYRFLDCQRVKPDSIRTAHREQTLRRIGGHDRILVIQDTTEVDFTSHPATTGLGHLDHAKHQGLKVHSGLAATLAGVPLGLVYQHVWTRDAATKGVKKRSRPQEEKESQRWISTLSEVEKVIPEDVSVVLVADREADIYPLFAASRQPRVDLLVRAAYNRSVDHETRKLEEAVAQAPIGGRLRVELPHSGNRPPRTATLTVRFTSIRMDPPHDAKGRANLPRVPLMVVVAEELSPPEGVKPLRWVLLTTLPVTTWEQAVEVVRLYRARWLIERYHYVLKSGCGFEQLQLETGERLQRALAVYSVVAWRLLWLTYEAREQPDEPCTLVLAEHEWQALYCTIHHTPIAPSEVPSLRQAVRWIAQLGGFLARKGDGEPGVQTIWRGLRRLEDSAATWLLLHPPTPSQLDISPYG